MMSGTSCLMHKRHVVFQPLVRGMDDLVDGKRCSVWIGRQFSLDADQPLVEQLLGAGALRAGKEPIRPPLHWAMTRSGLETMNIGAQMTGSDRLLVQ